MAFFFGGFDTMATALAFASYELALHPDIQDKLHEEIDSVLGKEDEITYDAVINQMPYLDMVIKGSKRNSS